MEANIMKSLVLEYLKKEDKLLAETFQKKVKPVSGLSVKRSIPRNYLVNQ